MLSLLMMICDAKCCEAAPRLGLSPLCLSSGKQKFLVFTIRQRSQHEGGKKMTSAKKYRGPFNSQQMTQKPDIIRI